MDLSTCSEIEVSKFLWSELKLRSLKIDFSSKFIVLRKQYLETINRKSIKGGNFLSYSWCGVNTLNVLEKVVLHTLVAAGKLCWSGRTKFAKSNCKRCATVVTSDSSLSETESGSSSGEMADCELSQTAVESEYECGG